MNSFLAAVSQAAGCSLDLSMCTIGVVAETRRSFVRLDRSLVAIDAGDVASLAVVPRPPMIG